MSYYTQRTDRQLHKDYRNAIKDLNDLVESYNNGSQYRYGEPIMRQISSQRREIVTIEAELQYRNTDIKTIRNVPNKVRQFTFKEVDQLKEAKEEAYNERAVREQAEQVAKAEQPLIDAMNKVMQFAFNYDMWFVVNAELSPSDHLQSKWSNMYDSKQPTASFMKFWAELDYENRAQLMRYIIRKVK